MKEAVKIERVYFVKGKMLFPLEVKKKFSFKAKNDQSQKKIINSVKNKQNKN